MKTDSQILSELNDRQEIHDVLMRYSRAIDRLDRDLLKSVYHPDANDDHGAFKGNGHDFADWVMEALKRVHVTQHRVANVLIELEGAIAYTESYFTAVHVSADISLQETVYGRYIDRMEKRDGAWRIADRRVILDWTRSDPAGERYPHEDAFIRGRRDKSDPVYKRSETP